MRTKTNLVGWTVSQIMLCILIPGQSHAEIADIDGDWPNAFEVIVEEILDGNPLNDWDEVYGIRGSHRFFPGNLGIEAGIGYAQPDSDLGDAELLLLDLSAVWYANARSLYKSDRPGGKPWHRNWRVKPELIVFGGPGWASLRIKDAVPNFPLPDASKDFFTVNGGFGAKLYWLSDDPEKGWDHRTSRTYLRTELRARWFVGDGGEVDLGVSLALGYSLGYRPSRLALDLKVAEACKEVDQYLSEEGLLGEKERNLQKADELLRKTKEYREDLEELKARAVTCGPKCSRSCLDDGIGKLNEVLSELRLLAESAG